MNIMKPFFLSFILIGTLCVFPHISHGRPSACLQLLEKFSYPLQPMTDETELIPIDNHAFYEILAPGHSLRTVLPGASKVIVAYLKSSEKNDPAKPVFLVGVFRTTTDKRTEIYSFLPKEKYTSDSYLQKLARRLRSHEFNAQTSKKMGYLQFAVKNPKGGHKISFFILPHVHEGNQIYSRVLIKTALAYLPYNPKDKGLILGSGAGQDAVMLKQHTGAFVTATDIDHNSILATQANAQVHGVDIKVIESDLFKNIKGRYDWIVFNAPRPLMFPLMYHPNNPGRRKWLRDFVSQWGQWALHNSQGRPLNDYFITWRFYSDWLEYAEGKTDLFDPRGRLLMRLLNQLDSVLTPTGKLILMTDSAIEKVLPQNLKITKLSTDVSWGAKNKHAPTFAIFLIERR